MRLSVLRFFLLLGLLAGSFLSAHGDENIVQEFSGSGSTTTGFFKVQDRWEVRWNARQVISVAVMSSDGTIVAGAAGVLRGSLFVPLGGQYYFKISDGTTAPPAPATSTAPATNSPPSTNAAPATNSPPSTNAAPASPPADSSTDAAAPADEQPLSWHLQVVELGTSVASTQALTVYTPYFMMPDSAVTPAPAPPPAPPPPVLTDDQVHSLVTIKGDNAQGFGFLVKSPDGTFVVTHLHLLAANPNVTLSTDTGAVITVLSLKAATDCDLALFAIKDDHYHYLPLTTDATADVAIGDQLIIPDGPVIPNTTTVPPNSPVVPNPPVLPNAPVIPDASAVAPLAGKPAKVQALTPQRLDFDNLTGLAGNGAAFPPTGFGLNAAPNGTADSWSENDDGVPVIHVKNGKALAIMTAEKRVDLTDDIAQAWAANPTPGVAQIAPYYGLRLTSPSKWEVLDPQRFLAETLFLKQFHDDTRCLDSYLNGRHHHRDGGPPDTKYFLKNDKLHKANDSYKQIANGGDKDERIEAARELSFDLIDIANTGVSTLQAPGFYAFNELRAQEELAYRLAIKKEIDDLSSNINHLDNIAHMR
jgi:hypothetical protein